MSDSPQDLLPILFRDWQKIAAETVRCLGEEPASLFLYLYIDALEISRAIQNGYPEAERLDSLVFIEFTGLPKELHWLQALFLCGNYPIVLRQLRFNWERLFRARHADAYAEEHPGAADGPGPSLRDKHEWLTRREERLNWPRLIAPTLCCFFPAVCRRKPTRTSGPFGTGSTAACIPLGCCGRNWRGNRSFTSSMPSTRRRRGRRSPTRRKSSA